MSDWNIEPGWRFTQSQVLKALARGGSIVELVTKDQTVVAVVTITPPKRVNPATPKGKDDAE